LVLTSISLHHIKHEDNKDPAFQLIQTKLSQSISHIVYTNNSIIYQDECLHIHTCLNNLLHEHMV
jgi:hypothetical protein